MHQVTLQDDCQGQWGCEYRHVHPGSPTDSHPDQSHSSASPSPHVFHVIHLRVSTGPLASSDPNMGTLDLEGIPSRAPWLPHLSVFTCSGALWRNPPHGHRAGQVLFLRPEELFRPFSVPVSSESFIGERVIFHSEWRLLENRESFILMVPLRCETID